MTVTNVREMFAIIRPTSLTTVPLIVQTKSLGRKEKILPRDLR